MMGGPIDRSSISCAIPPPCGTMSLRTHDDGWCDLTLFGSVVGWAAVVSNRPRRRAAAHAKLIGASLMNLDEPS